MNGADVAVGGGPPPKGRLALVKIGAPVQVALSGPNRVKVTVPVGAGAAAGAPVTVAVSVMGPPSGTGAWPGWRWWPCAVFDDRGLVGRRRTGW